jgi:2-dehydro-3-deoxyphosphogalactonate aldolase
MTLGEALREAPLIAILRGVRPSEIVGQAEAFYEAGIRVIEVPLNSPEPLESIRLLSENFADRMVCGAGTVLNASDVDQVVAAGGKIIVAPNTDLAVIGRALDLGAVPLPGFASATEGFAAYRAGARYVKLFPAATYGFGHLAQLKAVLPPDAIVLPVGGVTADHLEDWWEAGARGFGIGSEIYRPGQTAEQTYRRAQHFMAELRQVA